MVTAQKLTIAELEALPDDGNRYELIDGQLITADALGITHQRTLGRLFYRMSDSLAKNTIGQCILAPGVVFDDYNSVIPDIAFVSSERQHIVTDRWLIDAPDLVIEVVSPGERNSERDRQIKRQLYGRRGVLEYWIVDPQLRTIEIYRLQENVLVLEFTLRGSDSLTSPLLFPGFSCAVSEIFG